MNRYSYVWNNPVNAVDPSGNSVISLFQGIISFFKNLFAGNKVDAAIDAAGVVFDAATLENELSGAGTVIKAARAARAAEKAAEAAKDARFVESKAKYIFDARIKRYRDTTTGRLVSQKNLPFPKSNEGFKSNTKGTLEPGTIVDRYGSGSGSYASQPGTTISERGLPQGSENLPYNKYEVIKSLDVKSGPTAEVPEFGATGGGIQYKFDRSVDQLIREGYLKVK